MDIEITPQRPEDFDDMLEALFVAFAEPASKEMLEAVRLVHEEDRTLLARDAGRIVGVASVVSFDMTVPGGTMPTAGVTSIGVLPTHRRRGVLAGLMRPMLDDIRDRGEPLAVLYASEAPIYGRYGFGPGTMMSELRIERPYNAFRDPVEPRTMRFVDKDEAARLFRPVYDAARAQRPGMFARNDAWWGYIVGDADNVGGGFGPAKHVVAEGPDGPDAYAIYRTKVDWHDGVPNGTLQMSELMAGSAAGYAAMWRYCLDIDLIQWVGAYLRPVDEPLVHLLADPRRLSVRVRDALWTRLVDAAAALAGRRYAAEDRLVIGVRDGVCEWNDTRLALTGGPDGAECSATDRLPDLTMSVDDLSSVFLGGVSLRTLAATGRIDEEVSGAVERADRMFSWAPPPWCPNFF